jgi:hypothetical protein
MKDISKVHTINTHIQRLGHKGTYRLDDTLRRFNSKIMADVIGRACPLQRRVGDIALQGSVFDRCPIIAMAGQVGRDDAMPRLFEEWDNLTLTPTTVICTVN